MKQIRLKQKSLLSIDNFLTCDMMIKITYTIICLAALLMSCSNQQSNKEKQPEQLPRLEQPA